MSFLPLRRVTLSIRSWNLVLLPGRCYPSDRAGAYGSGAAANPAHHRIGLALCRGRVGFSCHSSCLISPRQSGSVLGIEAGASPLRLRSRTRYVAAVWEGSLGRSLHHGTPQPRLLQPPSPLSKFSGRRTGLVSEDNGDGGGGPISSPIWPPPPPLRPPLGLLPAPHRARVKGVSSTHHEEVGGLPVFSPDFAFAKLAIRGQYRCVPYIYIFIYIYIACLRWSRWGLVAGPEGTRD